VSALAAADKTVRRKRETCGPMRMVSSAAWIRYSEVVNRKPLYGKEGGGREGGRG